MRGFRGLRVQLILQMFLPLAVVASLLVWTTFSVVERLIEARLENEIELVARTMQMPAQDALTEGALDRLQQTLGAVFEIGGVYGAYVFDAEGNRVLTAGELVPGRREQVQAAELAAAGEQRGQYEDLGGQQVYSYFVPLIGQAGQIEGLLQVTREQSEIALRLTQVRQRGWWLLGAVLVLMLGIVVVGHRFTVGRHVDRLMLTMEEVARGRKDLRARVSGPRELAALAHGLNRMLDGMQRIESELAERSREKAVMSIRMQEQEKYAALGKFSSGVAHELGAPLTVIDGDARRLANSDLGTDAGRRLERIRSQIRRTHRLIQQLMDFVRTDRRDMEAVGIHEILRQAVAGVQPEADSRGVDLELDLPEGPALVRGHAIRLEHGLINLIRNAVQATPGGKVRVRARQAGDQVSIVVEDDGPGIDPEARKQIFEPFHTTRDTGEGTGLGLAIVKSVIDEHGAEIRVESSKELGGSRFELLLASEETQ